MEPVFSKILQKTSAGDSKPHHNLSKFLNHQLTNDYIIVIYERQDNKRATIFIPLKRYPADIRCQYLYKKNKLPPVKYSTAGNHNPRRTLSYNKMEVATATFRDSASHGILIGLPFVKNTSDGPLFSFPTTIARDPAKFSL